VSYQLLSESESETRVLAAVIPGPVLAEYEAAARAAGWEPGAVLPTSLAALAAIDSLEAVLVAHLSRTALTTAIANGNDLLLYRTVDLPLDEALHEAEVERGVAVASAYFEDKLGLRPSTLLWSGLELSEEFALWAAEQELTLAALAPPPETGAVTSLGNSSIAGVRGALAGTR
jgi:type IV pilus assembly protein PilM